MPRNTTGGSGHKARSNSEGNITKKNRQMIENYIEDITKEGKCDGVHVAKVVKKLGDGRVNIAYFEGDRLMTVQAMIKGSLRGRGKSQAFIDGGSFVLAADTGLVGSMAFEIIAVLPPSGDPTRKKLEDAYPLDKFVSVATVGGPATGDIEFEYTKEEDDDIEVDDI